MSAPPECCIARADGQSWPCRSAWLVAFRAGSPSTGGPRRSLTRANPRVSPTRRFLLDLARRSHLEVAGTSSL